MLDTRSRSEFLALTGVRSATLDQRVKVGEAAFAFGVERPAHVGEYPVLHAFATILASVLNCRCGLSLKAAVDAVREHWDGWLPLLTRVERWAERHPYDPQLFFAVAWLFTSNAALTHRIVTGDGADIAKALAGEHVYTVNHVSIALVRHQLYVNAANAGITLPARLTVDPDDDKPAYDKWRAEIDAYREAAGARVAKAKAPA